MSPFRTMLLSLAVIACSGDDTTKPTPTGDTGTTDTTDKTDATGDSGTEVTSLDVSIDVSGAISTSRVAVLRGTFDGKTFKQEEVVDDVAAATTVTTTLPEPASTSLYLFVLYDDADASGAFDGDGIHGASTMTRSWTADDGWVANAWLPDAEPAAVELDSAVALEPQYGTVPTIEATVDVSKISNPERLTTVSAFGDVMDPSGALFDQAIDGKTVSATPAVPAKSRFRNPAGVELAYEYVIAIDDVDDSGSYTAKDPLAAWVCTGSDSVRLVYVEPPADPWVAFARAIYEVPSGWRMIRGFGKHGALLVVTEAEAKALVLSDTACSF